MEKLIENYENQLTCSDKILYQIQNFELLSLIYDDETKYVLNGEDTDMYIKPNFGVFKYDNLEQILLIRQLINFVCSKFNCSDSNLELFKNDALVDVIVLKNCVIKFYSLKKYHYLLPIFSLKHANIENVLFKTETKYFGMVVTEKLFTCDKIKVDTEQLLQDITQGLSALKKINFTHNDCRIDNIGFNKGNYVLYDFGISSLGGTKDDLRDLYISLKFKNLL